MLSMGWPGIIVGNAHPELKALRDNHVYHAKGEYADGVVEGAKHWLARVS